MHKLVLFGAILLRINFLQVPRGVRKEKRQIRPPKLEFGGDAKGRLPWLRVCTYSALARARGVADRKHARARLSLMWRPKLYAVAKFLKGARALKSTSSSFLFANNLLTLKPLSCSLVSYLDSLR